MVGALAPNPLWHELLRRAPIAALVVFLFLLFTFQEPVSTAAAGAGANAEPLRLEAKIPLGPVRGRIDHMAIDLARQHLFVAELGNDSVGVVDLKEHKTVHTIGGLAEPQGVGYAPSTDAIYVANARDGSVRIFRGAEADAAKVHSWRMRCDREPAIDVAARRVVVVETAGFEQEQPRKPACWQWSAACKGAGRALLARAACQDRLFKNRKIKVVWHTVLHDIIGSKNPFKVTHAHLRNVKTGAVSKRRIEGIFIAIGRTPAIELVAGQVETKPTGYIKTAPYSTETSIAGFFAAAALPTTFTVRP